MSWMRASDGLGATIGPVLVTALLSEGLSWRSAYGVMAAAEAALASVFVLTRRAWPAHLGSVAALMPGPDSCHLSRQPPRPTGDRCR